MQRVISILAICFILILPLGILLVINFDSIKERFIAIRYSFHPSSNPQIIVSSQIPDLKPTIANSAFLDYEFSRLGVFKPNAIADPRVHRGVADATSRFTVTNVEIVLVPTLLNYLVANGGTKDFAARGSYRVQYGTLFLELSLNMDEISDYPNAKEDVLLRTLLETLLYAIKQPNIALDMHELFVIQQNLQEYITSGLFDRPIRVVEKTTEL